jgi:hypothetical protein
MTIKKNGWVNFSTSAGTPGVAAQADFDPDAAFEVNVVNSAGNVSSGALLAPMTLAQRGTIPSGNLVDGIEIYCKDCLDGQGNAGVKQTYQLSTTSWQSQSSAKLREQPFVATAGQTVFNLSGYVPIPPSGDAYPVRVYRNGVRLTYSAAAPTVREYSYSGAAITMSACGLDDFILIEYLK